MQSQPQSTLFQEPEQAVLVSHGTELYNLGKKRQINYFTVLDKTSNEWMSYQIPTIQSADNSEREGCAIVGTPYMHKDGTIYIAAAGGVLNRFTKDGDGYRHEYAILNGKSTPFFIANNTSACLLAIGDKPVAEPLIQRNIDGAEVTRPFFQSYREQNPDYNMLVEQGLITTAKRDAIWAKAKRKISRKVCSINMALEKVRQSSSEEAEVYRAALRSKDGPLKDEVLRIWERNNDEFKSANGSQPVGEAFDKLVYGLYDQCYLQTNPLTEKDQAEIIKAADTAQMKAEIMAKKTRLFTPKPGRKIYDERLPVFRGSVAEMPGDDNTLAVAVVGHLYRINHITGAIDYHGRATSDHLAVPMICNDGLPTQETYVPDVDNRGLVALDDKTFILADMGIDEVVNGPRTLRVVADNGDGTVTINQKLTDQLLDKLKPHWTTNGQENITPRVKAMVSVRERAIATVDAPVEIYLRTKHAGKDLLKVNVQMSNGELAVGEPEELKLSGSVNCEFFSIVGQTLLTGRETEDYVRHGYLPSVKHHVSAFKTGQTPETQQPANILPELPKWVFYTGHGYDGIFTR